MKKLKNRHVMELIGTFLILLSAGFQVFFVTPSQSMANDETTLLLRQRLDTIWSYLGRADTAEAHDELSPIFYQFDEEDAWQHIASHGSKFAGITFLIGSALVLSARFLELQLQSGGEPRASLEQQLGMPVKQVRRKRRNRSAP